MTSIENAIETVEHQIEIPSELPTDNPVLRFVFYMARRGLVRTVWNDIDFSDACLIDDGTAEPFDILGNDEKGDFDESCDSADSGEDVEIHLGIGLQRHTSSISWSALKWVPSCNAVTASNKTTQ